jgi:hypothetical protein
VRVLIITNDTRLSSIDVGRFRDFGDPDDIEIKHGFNAGMEFIQNYVLRDQKHIDLIIVSRQKKTNPWDFEYEDNHIDDFAIWLRDLSENYSSDNFQISSIPLILDDEETLHRSLFIASFKNKFYDLITNLKSIRDDRILYILGKPINSWLNKLGDELDRVDLDTQFDFAKSLVPKKDSFDTKILSNNFFLRLQKLDYAWIGDNIKRLYVDADMFKKLLDKSDKDKKLRNEKEDYHSFLLRYQGLFLGDQYSKTIYENHFYYRMSQKYVEPDFVNLPYSHSFYSPQIFEIKLPNQRLVNLNGQISRYFKNSTGQVGTKYMNYFLNKNGNREQIIKGLNQQELKNFESQNFVHRLLIGRQRDKDENQEIINDYLLTKRYKIDIITYDELLSKYQMIYDRVNRFGLK